MVLGFLPLVAGFVLTSIWVAWSDIRQRGVVDYAWVPAVVGALWFYSTFPLKGFLPTGIFLGGVGLVALTFKLTKSEKLKVKQADLIGLVIFAAWPLAFLYAAPFAAASSIGLLRWGRWSSAPFAGLLALFFVPAMVLLLI